MRKGLPSIFSFHFAPPGNLVIYVVRFTAIDITAQALASSGLHTFNNLVATSPRVGHSYLSDDFSRATEVLNVVVFSVDDLLF